MTTNDPGGGGSGGNGDKPNIANLQESFSKQQAKISELKELVRKSEAAHGISTSTAQEKVKNIAQRLTHLKSKARSRQNLDRSLSEFRDEIIVEESNISLDLHSQSSSDLSYTVSSHQKSRSETPGSDKIQLLRQQMQQNKLKMAERENSKREIEEQLNQLRAKFDSTQQSLERSSELGRSMGDLSSLSSVPTRDKFKSATDLSFAPLNLDKERIKFLENRISMLDKQLEKAKNTPIDESAQPMKIKQLENQILDLEESLKEKQCIIDARTQAVSLMSESLSAKGKTTVDLLEDTRQEMFKMQTDFLAKEDSYKVEIQELKDTLDQKNMKILNFEEVNDILETARFDLTIKNAELESKIEDVQDYSTKLSELNKLNENLQHRIADLENQKQENTNSNDDIDIAKQVGIKYASDIQNLQERIKELEIENDSLKKMAQDSQTSPSLDITDDNASNQIKSLEATIEAQREDIEKQHEKIQQLEEQIAEKTIEYNVLNANFSVLQEKLKASAPKSLFSKTNDEEAEIEINKLKSQLDETNKSMIKMKLKTKQLQKQIDSFKKISDVNNEVIRLTEENQQLQQKVTELEDEKGSLQLKLVTCDTNTIPDTELEEKLQILETTCQNQTSAIQLLEEQKMDMTEDLQTAKQELESLKDHMQEIDREETAKVVSHMESVKLEEQVEDGLSHINSLVVEIKKYQEENENLRDDLKQLEQEKNELNKKIDHYVAENMELLDKIEKLSKSSSSAESIEIVERLTQQEKMEIEAFNKRLEEENINETPSVSNAPSIGDGEGGGAIGQELSESLVKLREESSELMHKIELFTTERREVLEKMEILNNENQEHLRKISKLSDEKLEMENNYKALSDDKVTLEQRLTDVLKEKDDLSNDIKEIMQIRRNLEDQLNTLIKEKQSISSLVPPTPILPTEDLDLCEKSLNRLNNELENYKKSDKNNRFNVCKKLAKEAKNAHQQIFEIIQKFRNLPKQDVVDLATESSSSISEMKDRISELEKNIDKSQFEFFNLKKSADEKDEEINRLNSNITKLSNDKEQQQTSDIVELEKLRKDFEMKLLTSEKEIEILKELVAEQKQQLIESYTDHETETNSSMEKIQQYENQIENLKIELTRAQNEKNNSYNDYVQKLEHEIKKLENICSENKELLDFQSRDILNKRDTIEILNSQIMDLYKTMETNSNLLQEKENEIINLQSLIENNKTEITKFCQESDENRKVIDRLLLELHSNNKKLEILDSLSINKYQSKELEIRVIELEKLNSELEHKNKDQLDKLKKFAANFKKKVNQCNELEEKLKRIETSTKSEEIIISKNVSELENQIKYHQNQFDGLKSSRDQQIQNLQQELEQIKNENQILHAEKENTYLMIENLQQELSNKQIEIEKLNINQNELQKLPNILQMEINQKNDEIQTFITQIATKTQELNISNENLNMKNMKFEKSKAILKEKIREIQRLTAENKSLNDKLKTYTVEVEEKIVSNSNIEQDYVKLKEDHKNLIEKYETEKITFQETISRLETLHDGIQAKLQEDMGYIESLEMENNKIKDKIFKLEECVANFEDRRSSLERQSKTLEGQLQKRSDEYERNEDALIYRLNMLSEHDDVIGRRLLETQEENEELLEKLERLKSEHTELISKFSKMEKDFDTFKTEKYDIIQFENQALQEQLKAIQIDMQKIQANYELKLANKNSEIDDLENDLSIQLQTVNTEKRSLQENLEKSLDEINELKDENIKLKESNHSLEQNKNDLEREITWIRMQNENLSQDQFELQELRMQIMQDKTEIENQKHQLDSLIQNHEIELNALRTQISELDSMRMQVSQNQTDDQVFIETENKRLKEVLAEKESAIENYQRQNLQLQMASLASLSTDSFTNLPLENRQDSSTPEIISIRERIATLELELSRLNGILMDKDELVNNTLKEINLLKQEINHLTLNNTELQKLNFEKQNEIINLKNDLERHSRSQHETVTSLYTDQGSISMFDEPIPFRHIEDLSTDAPDQRKIEDLVQNVSDLEKYVTDLEMKLKNLTQIHEETLLQSRQYEEKIRTHQEKIKELEEKLEAVTIQKSVENLIAPESKTTTDSKIPSLNMFFDTNPQEITVDFDDFVNTAKDSIPPVPVVEEVIVPKKAYLCHPETDQDQAEGWGWGSEEPTLDEKHLTTQTSLSLVTQDQQYEIKLQEYQDRIKELELERNHLEEKVIQLQVKSGKMMKKLKEYKTNNDQLQRSIKKSPSIESNDLDLAIQEELKNQNQQIEEKYNELKKQHTKDCAEKENLLKRLDVLTAANERMTEMKERQDTDVAMYQNQIRNLNQQLKKLEEWTEDPPEKSSISTDSNKPVDNSLLSDHFENLKAQLLENSKELEDLKIDRDELQALLDEEKENVRRSEYKIRELEMKIIAFENKSLDEIYAPENNLEKQIESLRSEIAIKETEFNNMKLKNQNLQSQLSDYESIIEQLTIESNSIKSHLNMLKDEHQKKLDENTNLTKELQTWIDRNNELSKEIEITKSETKSPSMEIHPNNEEFENRIQELNAQLQYKDAEILHLKQEIQDVIQEDQTQSLVQEILGKNSEILNLKQQVQTLENEKLELENNLSIQLTNEMNQKVQTNDNEATDDFKDKIEKLEKLVQDLNTEKSNMENELEVLNNHVLSSLELEDKMKQTILELDMKNIEITELKNTLEILKKQQQQPSESQETYSIQQHNDDIQQLNHQWENVVEQKCNEIAEIWKRHLAEKELELKTNEESLKLKIEELQKNLAAAPSTSPPNTNLLELDEKQDIAEGGNQLSSEMIEKMQLALENQEIEIVTLQEQLAMRSAEYARLAAQHDPYGQTTSSSLPFETKTIRKSSSDQTSSSVVPKSELDLALYMLHQRDMRTEELTLELLNLLEERDTLQLKLSNSIRQVEEIKRKTGYSESGTESDQSPSNTNSPEKVRTKLVQSTLEEDSLKNTNQLNEKLSQLHTVSYVRDKRIWEDKDQRNRQMEKIQKDVANIPSEAVSELVGADLSNTTQSPSSVLLNWLWGKTNDIPHQQS